VLRLPTGEREANELEEEVVVLLPLLLLLPLLAHKEAAAK